MGSWRIGAVGGMLVIGLCAPVGCSEESTGSGSGGAGGEGGTTTPSGPRCSGTPKPCEGRSSFDCSHLAGCNEEGACSGLAVACGAVTDEPSCAQQYGCVWMPSPAECPGDPNVCPAVCGGDPDACSTLSSVDLCTFQAGCAWESDACSGYPYACESYSSEGSCYIQTGCDWE